MITWKIDEEDFIELLENRVDFWVDDRTYEEKQAWYGYFENLVDRGYFCEVSDSINVIVDNTIVNYYSYFKDMEELKNDFPNDSDEELEDRIEYQDENGIIAYCC